METTNIRFTTFNPGESSFKIYFQEETNGFFTYTYFSYDLQGKPIYVSSTCARNEVQPIGTPPPEYSKAYSELYIYVRKILGEPLEEKRFTINDVSEAPWPWSENENECSVIIWKDAQSVYELTAAFTNDGKQLTITVGMYHDPGQCDLVSFLPFFYSSILLETFSQTPCVQLAIFCNIHVFSEGVVLSHILSSISTSCLT